MKRDFFDYMIEIMEKNPDVYLLMAGLGYPRVEELMAKYPRRAINTEASEQSTLDIAVGLAYAGKIPVCYSITPFLLYRAFETIRTYFSHENLHCILIGAGVKEEYGEHDGFSHSATDAPKILSTLENFKQYYPSDINELHKSINESIINKKPNFINIHK